MDKYRCYICVLMFETSCADLRRIRNPVV